MLCKDAKSARTAEHMLFFSHNVSVKRKRKGNSVYACQSLKNVGKPTTLSSGTSVLRWGKDRDESSGYAGNGQLSLVRLKECWWRHVPLMLLCSRSKRRVALLTGGTRQKTKSAEHWPFLFFRWEQLHRTYHPAQSRHFWHVSWRTGNNWTLKP